MEIHTSMTLVVVYQYWVLKIMIFFQKVTKLTGFLIFFEMEECECTLSAKDRGATKNPAVDLEIILVHLDLS